MIDNVQKYNISLYGILGLNCFFLLILQRAPGLSLTIGTATPALLVAMVVVIACFLKEWTGFLFGLVCGIGLDVFSSGSRSFNTVCLLIIGAFAGILYHYFFNRNIKSVIIGGTIFSFIYFILRWFYLCLLEGDSSALLMLVRYDLPSALYTSFFAIPLFYYIRWLVKRHLIRNI